LKIKAFIDGQFGTTGLELKERLIRHPSVELIEIDSAQRKHTPVRKAAMQDADVVFLCLPDAGSRVASQWIDPDTTVVIDASSEFRTHKDWVYGIPELVGAREALRVAPRIANPGCYPTGFALLIQPLVRAGIVPKNYPLSVQAITGFSGGGRAMIDEYEAMPDDQRVHAVAAYKSLGLDHKHLPEMQHVNGLDMAPLFVPTVGAFKRGMLVSVPLQQSWLNGDAQNIQEVYQHNYQHEAFVRLHRLNDYDALHNGYLQATASNGTNDVELFVYAKRGQIFLSARLDNLGKGASGAAVQNMNCRFGFDEGLGLKA